MLGDLEKKMRVLSQKSDIIYKALLEAGAPPIRGMK